MKALNKKFFITFLLLIFFIQMGVLTFTLSSYSRIKKYAEQNNRIVSLPCTFNDPFDPLKGRYVYLWFNEKVSPEKLEELKIDKLDLRKVNKYYTQENFAKVTEYIPWKESENLAPILEVYVSKTGFCIQKSLTVIDEKDGSRISIEDFCKRKIKK
ncbi:MAG: hypothetical protein HUK25_02840 [Treponema sp.]|nr:hypothetical protein [Treponema sp.]